MHVAYSLDGTHILAAGTTEAGVMEALEKAGIDPGETMSDFLTRRGWHSPGLWDAAARYP